MPFRIEELRSRQLVGFIELFARSNPGGRFRVFVEVPQPDVFVAGHCDRHLLRPPGEQFRSGHTDKDPQFRHVGLNPLRMPIADARLFFNDL